jgi:hypothetical protein
MARQSADIGGGSEVIDKNNQGTRIVLQSAHTLPEMPLIINDIFKHHALDWNSRDKMYDVISKTVKEYFPRESPEQIREIENKVFITLSEKRYERANSNLIHNTTVDRTNHNE